MLQVRLTFTDITLETKLKIFRFYEDFLQWANLYQDSILTLVTFSPQIFTHYSHFLSLLLNELKFDA